MVRINISALREGEHCFDFDEPAEDFDIADNVLISPVIIKVKVDKVSTQINLQINVTGRFSLSCDRCLKNYDDDFESSFALILKYDYTGELVGKDSSDPELNYISKDQHYYDLTNDLRDFIILSIPMRTVPDEVNGECIECGKKVEKLYNQYKDTEINPVWEKLLTKKKI
ncbi:MAG: metal-binding/nucleic-acid-binding protein [Chlorobi bacterium OLB4]|jgi:Predicted metal-binding, possibly nucleic acid-binding protein|nr:MAG: metal-binding/nucleic-acid-binding protein [Chlorobi bacterium OLB4]MBW7855771.1 DUF177 domain-containing protein [Ignavibacteria bacterium]OQY76507.1 MAG: hypothetical protein B6D43_10030 [Ignavibacteriales bacterium UTCHB1]